MRLLVIIFLFLVSFFSVRAQRGQSEYKEAKRRFREGDYAGAMRGFQELSQDSMFGAYATFYYALSAYHRGLHHVAMDGWKQVQIKYPDWNRMAEVNFWLALTAFELGEYEKSIEYVRLLPPALKKEFFANISGGLDADLSRQFGIDQVEDTQNLSRAKKDRYSVAVVLPFMFDSPENPQAVIRNRIIYHLYQGMLVARDSLESMGINLALFPYDTKKKKSYATQIVEDGLLDRADLIIGPLYAEPNEVIVSYTRQHQIPMVNPLSSNISMVAGHSFGYLFQPSYTTQGRMAAHYAIDKFRENKNVMILFETSRDRRMAKAYQQVIESEGFKVIKFEKLTRESGLRLQKDFSEQYEYDHHSLSEEGVDSINSLPGRHVISRVLRDPHTGRVEKTEEGEDVMRHYEMRFKIRRDSIGHIFAATSSNLLAQNIIGLVEVQGNHMGIIGYDDWLDFQQLSYSQMERLNLSLIHTFYFAKSHNKVKEKIRKVFCNEADKHHYLGFELIMQLGSLLDQEGGDFRRALSTENYRKGYLMEGLRYGAYQDNQIVPIVTIEGLELVVQNQEDYAR